MLCDFRGGDNRTSSVNLSRDASYVRLSDRRMNRKTFLLTAAGFSYIGVNAAKKSSGKTGPVIVQAGRRTDAADAQVPRFPLSMTETVRQRIQQVFISEKPSALVSAAACGTDLLALDLAGEMHIPRVVLLPAPPEKFRAESVVDRPGNWGPMFDKLMRQVKVEVISNGAGQDSYLQANLKLLDRAQGLAAQQKTAVLALVAWNGQSRGPDDVTEHFLVQARSRKFRVVEVRTV